MLTRDRRRTAFTLIELLVVVSIIAVLVALTATAAFGVRRNMQKQNAEVTLQKLDQVLEQRRKDIRDRIQDDINKNRATDEYNAALSLTGNADGAKAIMLYARLRQQLPMSFTEAKTTLTIGAGPTYIYPVSPAFASLPSVAGADLEMSASCLYTAVALAGMDGLEHQVGAGSTYGQKVFVDGFGQPIAFIRIAYDGTNNELNDRPQTLDPTKDPFDPLDKASAALSNVTLWNNLLGPTLTGAGTYNVNASPYRTAGAPTPVPLRSQRNHTVAIFSAGPNRVVIEPPTNNAFDGDNLFGYRLRREGRKGD